MAYTKVFAIRKRLDKSIAYAANEKKTGLAGMIEYAVNRSKTEQRLFESALKCQSPQTAYGEMMETKRRWGKQDGVQGYHFIQSFAPGEVTPEQAHAIGVEFARRLFGDRYEAVIGTHLDKDHLFITVLAFIMILTVYGRFFKIYMYAALSPVALASFAGESTSSFGKAYLKSYIAVCMEGAVIVLACIIFSTFASSGAPVIDPDASVVTQVWAYIGEVIFNMLVLVGLVKSADRIAKEMFGL